MRRWQDIIPYFAPGGLLLVAGHAVLQHDALARLLLGLNWLISPALALVAVFLSWRFNRSRLFFGALVLLMAGFLLRRYGGAAQIDQLFSRYLFHMALLLLPLNLLIFACWRERGLFTPQGLRRLGFIFLQLLLLIGLYGIRGPLIVRQMERMLFHSPVFGGLPVPALFVFLASGAWLLFSFQRGRDPLTHGFFWTSASVFVALLSGDSGRQSFLFNVAVLILVAAALETAHRMAFKDELTSLPGRRALNEAMLKLGPVYSLAMADVDFFKKFNDQYGHEVGDQVLAMVAAILARVGGGGRAFRYGGEEFTLLFPGRSAEETKPHLEKLRQEVEAAGFRLRGSGREKKTFRDRKKSASSGKRVSVTISLGLAQRDGKLKTPQAVLKAADQALYRAKEAGRNQVAV